VLENRSKTVEFLEGSNGRRHFHEVSYLPPCLPLSEAAFFAYFTYGRKIAGKAPNSDEATLKDGSETGPSRRPGQFEVGRRSDEGIPASRPRNHRGRGGASPLGHDGRLVFRPDPFQ